MKRFLLLIFAVAIVATMSAATDYGIEVNGTKITSDKLTVNPGSGTVTYNPSTCTLTFSNAIFSRSGEALKVKESSNRSALLKMVFNGTCLLTSTGNDAVVLEDAADFIINGVTVITTHSSEKYAVHIKNDMDADFDGSGSLQLAASDGYALGGESGGDEWAYFKINACSLNGKRGNLVNLGRVQIQPVSMNVEMSTSITLETTNSSYYPHAKNVDEWILKDDVHIDSPLGLTTSDISVFSNYKKQFVINDDRDDPNSGYYSIGNFLYTTTYLKSENVTVARLMGPKKTYKRSQPSKVTVPGFVSINGTYYPTYVNDGALKDMTKTETIVYEYGVIHIGNHAMENCSSLEHIYLPSSARSLSAILYNTSSLGLYLKVYWATLDPSEVSIEDDSFTDSQATRCSFIFSTKAASEQAQYIPGVENRSVSPSSAHDYEYPDYSYYVIQNKATQRTTNGIMSLVGMSDKTVDNKYESTAFTTGGNAYYPKQVAPSAFKDNTYITMVDLTGFEYIGDKAFNGCNISMLTVGKEVIRIGIEAFFNCTSLRTVVWNPVFCEIDCNNAFTNSTNINSFSFGNEVTTIPAYLCSGLNKITSISIPNSVEYIRESAFYGCSGLTSLSIGGGVKTIEQNAFAGCTGLGSVTIPASTTTIGERAFWNCTGLTSVTVGKNVSTMGRLAFGHCSTLTTVNWIARSCADFGNGTSPFDTSNAISNFKFGSEVTKIPAYLCSGLKSVTNVTIPASVITIGKYAFVDCSNMNTLTIGRSVFTIGEEAFGLCGALRNIYPKMTAPQNLTYGSLVFYGVDKQTCKLTVPKGTRAMYKATMPWSEFYNIEVEGGFEPGDVNGDSVVNGADVTALYNVLLDGATPDGDADVNGDGVVNGADVTALYNLLLN